MARVADPATLLAPFLGVPCGLPLPSASCRRPCLLLMIPRRFWREVIEWWFGSEKGGGKGGKPLLNVKTGQVLVEEARVEKDGAGRCVQKRQVGRRVI